MAYAGGYTYIAAGLRNVREYVQTKLTDTLQAAKKYYVEFFVSLCDSCWYGNDFIGVYFSVDSIGSNDYYDLPYIPQVSNDSGNVITDKINWTKISGTFIAQGGEKYITIGNFKPDSLTDTIFVGGGQNKPFAYYYIDDVSVFLIDSACQAATFNFNASDTVTRKGDSIYFTGEATINQSDSVIRWWWDFGDGITDTVKNPQHIYNDTGVYTVRLKVTTQWGCEDSVEKKDYIVVQKDNGITDRQKGNLINVQVIPNPFSTNAVIRITTPTQNHQYEFQIYDVLGCKVYQSEIKNQKSEIKNHNLPSGIYFYKLTDKNNNYANGKIIISD